MKKIPAFLVLVFIFFAPPIFAQLPSPESHLGYRVGTDRKLADWQEITDYFHRLDRASDRMQVVELGKSTEGRSLLMAIITAPENFSRLDDILTIQRRLTDPRLLPPDSLANYLQRGRTVVMINCSIHSTEIAASQMAMELAHQLASATDARTQEILQHVVLLLLPSSNPDGIQLVVDWYKKYLGTAFEGSNPPRLYHPYAGHDDNRDWFMLNLVETRLVTAALYQKWFPQILYDIHQMGQKGPRFFVPPFYEVSNPNIDPIILRAILQIGGHITTDLTAAGFTGIATEWTFDTWWHGGMRTAPYFHNIVGLLTEAASCKLATPVEIKFEELSGSGRGLSNAREFQTNFPEPWPGGWWRLRDIVDYELAACYSVLTVAARYRDQWLHNLYRLGQRAIAKGKTESPRAYLIPLSQADPAAAQQLIDILLLQGTEILRAKKTFTAEGKQHPAGTFVIDLAQPYRANVVALFEKQNYPARPRYSGGPLEQPYDVTGWTLPLQMGVQVFACAKDFGVKELVADTFSVFNLPNGRLPAGQFIAANVPRDHGEYFVISSNSLDAYRLVNRLFETGASVFWNSERPFGKNFAPGHLLVPMIEVGAEQLQRLVNDLNVQLSVVDGSGSFEALSLRRPKVGLYRSFVPTADEGWTRWVLEAFEFEYQTLEDGDLRRGQFIDEFDAIIFSDQRDSTILLGHSPDDQENPYPPEFTGGIGMVGLANVRRFVERGGTLLAFDSATKLFIGQWALPVVNVLEKLKPHEFSAPGSLLRGIADTNQPIAYGVPREATLFFGNSPAFTAKGGRTIVKYPLQNPLLSGWLQGESKLHGKSALVEMPLGRGRIILFGFRPQHRGQTYAAFKFVFNSLLYAAAQEVKLGKMSVAE